MSDCVKEKLDEIAARVMSGLKDFQKATVDRVADLFENGVNRVLVSDEVGLGKTLIARGVIARYAQHRKKIGDDLVKVVYVCSNGAIAEQNLKKLKITDEARTENLNSSRLSMQHLNIAMQENDPKVKKRLHTVNTYNAEHVVSNIKQSRRSGRTRFDVCDIKTRARLVGLR